MLVRVRSRPKGRPKQSNCCYGDKEWFDLEAAWETLILDLLPLLLP